MTPILAKVTAIEKRGDQYHVIVQISPKYRGSFNTLAFGEIKPHSGSLTDFAILRLMRDLELRGAEIVELCLEDIDWRAGTLVVRDERLGANIKLQLDIVSFFDIDFERPAEVLADQCAGCASRLDRGVEILIHN